MRRRFITCEIGCVLLSILLLCPRVFATCPPYPTDFQRYYSANKSYYLEVIPRKLEGQLGKRDAGSSEGLPDNSCKGIFYKLDADKGYQQEWSASLFNSVSPNNALVSDNGKYVVTFGDWCSTGVVVIYGSHGELIKKLGLEDILSREEIAQIPLTTGPINWEGSHYLDEKNNLLVLKVVSNGKTPWDNDASFKEIKIDLDSGNLIAE